MRLALVILLAGAAAFGQSKQERGKHVVDAALDALGGAKFLAMRDRVEAGRAYSFYREEISGLSIATLYTQYTGGSDACDPTQLCVRERQSFGKEERSGAVLFAEGQGHEITFRGARPVPQENLDRYLLSTRMNILYILRMRLHEPGMVFEYQGRETVDNRPVEKVDITDSGNRTVTVFFDETTHLPSRQVYFRRDPKTRYRYEEVTLFAKYRDAGGGVMWPMDVQRFRDGDRIFQMYAESVAINQNLPDKLFVLPQGIKMLPRVR